MIVGLSPALKTARSQAVLNGLTAGSALHIYTAPQPAVGAALTTQILLISLPLDTPTGIVSGHTLTLYLRGAQAVASGAAAWARLEDGALAFCADFDVTATGGGGAITMDDVELYTGGTVQNMSAVLIEP